VDKVALMNMPKKWRWDVFHSTLLLAVILHLFFLMVYGVMRFDDRRGLTEIEILDDVELVEPMATPPATQISAGTGGATDTPAPYAPLDSSLPPGPAVPATDQGDAPQAPPPRKNPGSPGGGAPDMRGTGLSGSGPGVNPGGNPLNALQELRPIYATDGSGSATGSGEPAPGMGDGSGSGPGGGGTGGGLGSGSGGGGTGGGGGGGGVGRGDPGFVSFEWHKRDWDTEPTGTIPPREIYLPKRYDTSRGYMQGTCYIQVTVTIQGSPTDIKVYRSSGNVDLDRQAMALMAQTQWNPAMKDGNATNYQIVVPIIFY